MSASQISSLENHEFVFFKLSVCIHIYGCLQVQLIHHLTHFTKIMAWMNLHNATG